MGTTTDDSSRSHRRATAEKSRSGADGPSLDGKPPRRAPQYRLIAGDPIGAGVRFGGGELTTVEPKVQLPCRPRWGFVAGAAEVLDDRVSLQPTEIEAGAERDNRPGTGVTDRHGDRVGICPDSSRPRVQDGCAMAAEPAGVLSHQV